MDLNPKNILGPISSDCVGVYPFRAAAEILASLPPFPRNLGGTLSEMMSQIEIPLEWSLRLLITYTRCPTRRTVASGNN